MGIFTRLLDFEALFAEKVRDDTLIVNDVSNVTTEEREAFNSAIYTRYSPDDVLTNLPQCQGGHIIGEPDKGRLCNECNTLVENREGVSLDIAVWIRSPADVAPLINPMVWLMISNHFAIGDFNVIRFLADRSYKYDKRKPAILLSLEAMGIPRGYNYFVQNFHTLLTKLSEMKEYRVPAKKKKAAELMQLLRMDPRKIFTRYLPLPNKTLFVLEKNSTANFVDAAVPSAIDAIRTLAGIDAPNNVLNLNKRENRTAKVLDQLAQMGYAWHKDAASSKRGIYRKHVFSGRMEFSFRGVISSLSDVHDYDVLEFPWSIATTSLHLHIMNKMLAMGYAPNQAAEHINSHAYRFSPLLSRIFDELVEESPYKGLPLLLGRNPSLKRGSLQRLFGRVKKDVTDRTMSLSVLVLKELNADFDGDQTNVVFSLDNYAAEKQYEFAPHKNLLDLSEPRKLSDAMSIPKPHVGTIANYLQRATATPDPEKLARMMLIPDAP